MIGRRSMKSFSLVVLLIVLACQFVFSQRDVVEGEAVAVTTAEEAVETIASTVVDIPDFNLRKALESALQINAGEEITKEDLAGLKELEARDRKITDLSGLEHCTRLTFLYLYGNQISDISPLAVV